MPLSSRTFLRAGLALTALAAAACSRAPAPANNAAAAPAAEGSAPAPAGGGTNAALGDENSFVTGNMLFFMLHEAGHAMITEFHLPVLGREEDAVDQFASVVLIPDPDGEDNDASLITSSIAGWFISAGQSRIQDFPWYDEHAPDQARGYQIACLLYGSSPQTYTPMAESIGLPPERRETCPGEFQRVRESWSRVLGEHVLNDGEEPTQEVRVVYDAPGAFQAEHDMVQQAQLLENIAGEMRAGFRLTRPLTVRATTCGEPNAFWTAESGTLTLCYEFVQRYRQLYATLRQG